MSTTKPIGDQPLFPIREPAAHALTTLAFIATIGAVVFVALYCVAHFSQSAALKPLADLNASWYYESIGAAIVLALADGTVSYLRLPEKVEILEEKDIAESVEKKVLQDFQNTKIYEGLYLTADLPSKKGTIFALRTDGIGTQTHYFKSAAERTTFIQEQLVDLIDQREVFRALEIESESMPVMRMNEYYPCEVEIEGETFYAALYREKTSEGNIKTKFAFSKNPQTALEMEKFLNEEGIVNSKITEIFSHSNVSRKLIADGDYLTLKKDVGFGQSWIIFYRVKDEIVHETYYLESAMQLDIDLNRNLLQQDRTHTHVLIDKNDKGTVRRRFKQLIH